MKCLNETLLAFIDYIVLTLICGISMSPLQKALTAENAELAEFNFFLNRKESTLLMTNS
jgi:hypothetical protein